MLLTAGAPPKPRDVLLSAAVMAAERGKDGTSDWLLEAAKNDELGDVVDFLSSFNSAGAVILGRALGTGPDTYGLCDTETMKAAGKDDAAWLVRDADFESLRKVIRSREPSLKKLRDLVVAARGMGMPCTHLDSWLSFPIDELIRAIGATPPTCRGRPTFVTSYLQIGVGPGKPMLLSATEAEARLSDPADLTVVELKEDDVPYTGGLKYANGRTDPRTGFLTAPGPYEIHTHWYASEKLLTSMHVKQPPARGGTELNKWKQFFPHLVDRAVKIHHLKGVKM